MEEDGGAENRWAYNIAEWVGKNFAAAEALGPKKMEGDWFTPGEFRDQKQ